MFSYFMDNSSMINGNPNKVVNNLEAIELKTCETSKPVQCMRINDTYWP